VKQTKNILRKLVDFHTTDWRSWLPTVVFSMNNSIHSAIGYSTFFITYGSLPLDLLLPERINHKPSAFLKRLDSIITDVRLNLSIEKERQVQQYNKHRSTDDPAFAVGSYVMLNGEGITYSADKVRESKLIHRYLGPFKITDIISSVTRKLALPAKMFRIHPIFHIQLLKPYIAPQSFDPARNTVTRPPGVATLLGEEFEIKQILDKRTISGKIEYLIWWLGYPKEEASWIPFDSSDSSWIQSDLDLVQQFEATYTNSSTTSNNNDFSAGGGVRKSHKITKPAKPQALKSVSFVL
jgi:hypothetical protein